MEIKFNIKNLWKWFCNFSLWKIKRSRGKNYYPKKFNICFVKSKSLISDHDGSGMQTNQKEPNIELHLNFNLSATSSKLRKKIFMQFSVTCHIYEPIWICLTVPSAHRPIFYHRQKNRSENWFMCADFLLKKNQTFPFQQFVCDKKSLRVHWLQSNKKSE